MNRPIIAARGLRKVYRPGGPQVEALRGIDLEIQAGAFVVLLGPSGGGKTTLLNLLGGISKPTSGELIVCGVNLTQSSSAGLAAYRRDHIGIVFQFFQLLPTQTALENTALALLARGVPWTQARQEARRMLEQLGLGSRLDHHPNELSGGEQQRVAIARAIVGHPTLLLADEPTGNLDSENAAEVMGLLVRLHKELGVTCILATHNPDFCDAATMVLQLRDGLLHSSHLIL